MVEDLGVSGFGVDGVHGGRGSGTGLLGHARRRTAQNGHPHGALVAFPVEVDLGGLLSGRTCRIHGRRGSRSRSVGDRPSRSRFHDGKRVGEMGNGKLGHRGNTARRSAAAARRRARQRRASTGRHGNGKEAGSLRALRQALGGLELLRVVLPAWGMGRAAGHGWPPAVLSC